MTDQLTKAKSTGQRRNLKNLIDKFNIKALKIANMII